MFVRNLGNYDNHNIALKKSVSLNGYAYLIAEIRKNLIKFGSRDKAIKWAINTCIEKGILAEFPKKNYEGVVKMLNLEYDEEAAMMAKYEDGIEVGKEEGIIEGKEKRSREIAENMIKLKVPMEIIVKSTGLSIETLVELEKGLAYSRK